MDKELDGIHGCHLVRGFYILYCAVFFLFLQHTFYLSIGLLKVEIYLCPYINNLVFKF